MSVLGLEMTVAENLGIYFGRAGNPLPHESFSPLQCHSRGHLTISQQELTCIQFTHAVPFIAHPPT